MRAPLAAAKGEREGAAGMWAPLVAAKRGGWSTGWWAPPGSGTGRERDVAVGLARLKPAGQPWGGGGDTRGHRR
jgi:hypothetical protein